VGSPNVFKCPIHPEQRSSYAFNVRLSGNKVSEINPRTVLLFESNGGWNTAGGMEQMDLDRHRSFTVNVVFVDGSVQSVQKTELNMLRWDP
jgi:prepilin-type processing-associated H-X9-DG protein